MSDGGSCPGLTPPHTHLVLLTIAQSSPGFARLSISKYIICVAAMLPLRILLFFLIAYVRFVSECPHDFKKFRSGDLHPYFKKVENDIK